MLRFAAITRALALGALALLTAGCATTAKYEAFLNTWIGAPEKALISSWGTPHRVYDSDGTRWITFVKTETTHLSGSSPTYVKNKKGDYVPVGGSAPQTITSTCETTFELESGTVRSWRHRGDDCEME